MEILTAAHVDAERRMREIAASAGLPPPDEVEHRADEVVFLWHETKLAVVVELGDAGAAS